MGVSEKSAPSGVLAGSERLLDAPGIAIDRMPMLHVILDRMIAQCSENLRQLSAPPAFFSVDTVAARRVGDVLDAYENKVAIGVYHALAWDSRILIGLDHDFIFTLAEALFGGDGGEAPFTQGRKLSSLELRLAHKALDLFGRALQSAFSTVSDTAFKLERVETRLDFAVIAPRNAFGVTAKIKLRILGRHGEMFILIPQAALNSVRQQLGRNLSDDAAVRDPAWTRQIEGEIGRAEIEVRGVIEERHFLLGDIADLKVGGILQLKSTPSTRVRLECNAEPLFWCNLGQGDGVYTLRIDESMSREQEFVDEMLSR
ncbi:surface presentation of antigens (SPOA) protein [Methylocella silvestris BL2]|uniref:Flagellar motor switch protein FliM n=1 Tax=Methylocella silvestris (strain DSM 15510 / CIP 108128 / LMG 27833 / NCIMB 13906 / BL2) TaxID=395965 RepID=B8EL07_METSB|nr:FliM/FliN family flagellar motor switch protein [Methylocella silvestris]ACK49002.1 surface presentation of antigens (SPOA) protein [Methylocella silvestris BL2]